MCAVNIPSTHLPTSDSPFRNDSPVSQRGERSIQRQMPIPDTRFHREGIHIARSPFRRLLRDVTRDAT